LYHSYLEYALFNKYKNELEKKSNVHFIDTYIMLWSTVKMAIRIPTTVTPEINV